MIYQESRISVVINDMDHAKFVSNWPQGYKSMIIRKVIKELYDESNQGKKFNHLMDFISGRYNIDFKDAT